MDPLALGSSVPDFSLTDLDGRVHQLHRLNRDKAVFLWMTNLCPGCQHNIPLVERLHREWSRYLHVLVISVLGNDRATPHAVRSAHHSTFPILLDPNDWVGGVLGLFHAPGACPMHNLLLLNREGRITLRGHLSGLKEDRVMEAIRALEPAQT